MILACSLVILHVCFSTSLCDFAHCIGIYGHLVKANRKCRKFYSGLLLSDKNCDKIEQIEAMGLVTFEIIPKSVFVFAFSRLS